MQLSKEFDRSFKINIFVATIAKIDKKVNAIGHRCT